MAISLLILVVIAGMLFVVIGALDFEKPVEEERRPMARRFESGERAPVMDDAVVTEQTEQPTGKGYTGGYITFKTAAEQADYKKWLNDPKGYQHDWIGK
jgi:hypothetical protein